MYLSISLYNVNKQISIKCAKRSIIKSTCVRLGIYFLYISMYSSNVKDDKGITYDLIRNIIRYKKGRLSII